MALKFATPPYKHQRAFVRMGLKTPRLAGFMQPGLGKTKGSIDLIVNLAEKRERALPALIVVPKRTLMQWQEEFRTHGPNVKVGVVTAEKTRISLRRPPDVYLTNYRQVEQAFDFWERVRPQHIILDESIFIKNPTSGRSKALRDLAKTCKTPFRLILNGTPIGKTLLDIFGQLLWLDDGDTYGDNFYKFRNRYFVELPCGWVMRRGMKKQALRLLKGTAFVRLKKNCLDLPPKIYQYHTCPLKGKQLKHYRALQKEWLTLLKSGEEVGTIWKIAQNTLLWEVCNGFLNKDGETVAQFNTGKDDLLLSSLEELLCWPDKKIIIWAWFHHSIERIRALLTSMGVPHVWLHGKVSSRVATRAQRLFNGNRRVRVFVGQQASGGFGLNLQKSGCSDVLYYDRSQWVLHRQQSEDRVHRIGMPDRSPVYRDLIVEDSIDWKIYRSVKAGHDFSLEVQDFLATL